MVPVPHILMAKKLQVTTKMLLIFLSKIQTAQTKHVLRAKSVRKLIMKLVIVRVKIHLSIPFYSPQENMATTSTILDPEWYLDSGASNHVVTAICLRNLPLASPYEGNEQLTVGNGKSLPIINVGKTILPYSSRSLSLTNVLHVPHITNNLRSIPKIVILSNCTLLVLSWITRAKFYYGGK